ncbi:MAG TPA: glycosyltransferase family 2 protein [Chroococcales cyanobacterium]
MLKTEPDRGSKSQTGDFYPQWQGQGNLSRWHAHLYKTIAAEISALGKYYDELIQLEPLPGDSGFLLSQIEAANKSVRRQVADLNIGDRRALILLNGNFNHSTDIELLLSNLKPALNRQSRLTVVAYNPYYAWLYKFATRMGWRQGQMPETFLTETDLINIAKLSGYEVVRVRPVGFSPLRLSGAGDALNAILPTIPWFKCLSLTHVITMRPLIRSHKPSLSILIPARNERGNIEAALSRLPEFPGTRLEIIFVEGHSKDGTWEEIQRVKQLYAHKFAIKTFQQTGIGKADAVRLGLAKSTCETAVILDADLSTPPELMTRFYEAYCAGLGDFINGSRLLYPIEGQAMKFLNRLGNIFFAKALSRVLGVRLSDTLCGTKLFSLDSYARFLSWRNHFGDFDPFGDFELLFPAAELGLGIVDVPIRYRDRTYGETNISRFRHGLMLLKMTLVGLLRISVGKIPH